MLAFSRVENPPPYQSQSSLRRVPENDRDSLDDYGEGHQFDEDGSFIEEYVEEKKNSTDGKDPALATFVWVSAYTKLFNWSTTEH